MSLVQDDQNCEETTTLVEELLSRLEIVESKLRKQNKQLKDQKEKLEEQTEKLEEQRESALCRICLDRERNTVILPCGHATCCKECAKPLQNCPICRKEIDKVLEIFL